MCNLLVSAIFHSFSFEQAANWHRRSGGGAKHAVRRNLQLTLQCRCVSLRVADFAIPARTPLVIQGSGSDGDADTVKYVSGSGATGDQRPGAIGCGLAVPYLCLEVYTTGRASAKRYLPARFSNVVSRHV